MLHAFEMVKMMSGEAEETMNKLKGNCQVRLFLE